MIRGQQGLKLDLRAAHYAVRSICGLPIIMRVKILIVDDNDGCGSQVDPNRPVNPLFAIRYGNIPDTSGFRGQEKDGDVGIIVEFIDQALPLIRPRTSVQPRVLDAKVIEGDLKDVENHDEL